MSRQQNEREWNDPANWRGRVFKLYHSSRDSRIVVPKRNPALGWTFNTAHPLGLALTTALLAGTAILLGRSMK